jgi:hypothetical protein
LGFIDNASAWIMDIGDTKDLIYCLSIEVPLIIFVMILVSAITCPCCISWTHTHVEQLSLVWCPMVTILDSIVDILRTFSLASHVWHYDLSWTS